MPANQDKNTLGTILLVTYVKIIPFTQDKTCQDSLEKYIITNNYAFLKKMEL